jgi:hypothetical protein
MCLLVLTCTVQAGTGISEELKREILDILKRNSLMIVRREINDFVECNNREVTAIDIKGKRFNFETCENIDLCREVVRCMSRL